MSIHKNSQHDHSHHAEGSELGKPTQYVNHYSPELLYPISRQLARDALHISGTLPFRGEDIWTAWEVSWLNEKGKPQVAVAEFRIPVTSPNIIESKSFKLYLNSLNQTRVGSWEELKQRLMRDLSETAGEPVQVELVSLQEAASGLWGKGLHTPQQTGFAESRELPVVLVDNLDIEVDTYLPNAEFLKVNSEEFVEEILVSDLLKSNCPVTGQPDWASVWVHYEGPRLSHEGFLRYIISLRDFQDFHEQCVETLFMDIQRHCAPTKLSVLARYTRRGGLDINPFRSSEQVAPPLGRLVRQ
ncbi:NADPH-dependent 7-cyano-7-deazaguanine reductase QueF [Marinibactrum halimedae]|uniref:NADPH-dependent 7-cyano-7-deazaguanine reductase n=1 Tax=Marinibactrum halimedae TaxID=1444977 RepID=A0AA37WPM5_9GAMM|nr:NADPH-dependent 7-cyano-7-deazaguanine reductase QueF [Marinibactrum halimedae]MCD9457862.1 NADPH-dependent 7-cyano-7-deazaguanine reductase QueF [Marinibactrum halimedae]GLS26317.1 NADPH-dependent 7-cyano-7-deazaguanine reductase [Marinibactrum halimedae]